MSSIDLITVIRVPVSENKTGLLGILEGPLLPHPISRVFFVDSSNQKPRGQHGHKKCWQTLICLRGCIDLQMIDNQGGELFKSLTSAHEAVVIPPGIWAQQQGISDDNLLLVLASDLYDPADYFYDKPTVQ